MRDFYKWLAMTVIVFACLIAKTVYAEETVVGVSPDPYEKIWSVATDEDIEALRQCVYYESTRAFHDEDEAQVECNIAVVETVLNRCLQEGTRFPNTIKKVVYQEGEFSISDRKIRNDRVEQAIEYVRKNGRTVLPDYDYVHFATKRQSCARDHEWHGGKYVGMYFGRAK